MVHNKLLLLHGFFGMHMVLCSANQLINIEKREELTADVIKCSCSDSSSFFIIPHQSHEGERLAKLTFFLPDTSLISSLKRLLRELKSHAQEPYDLSISLVQRPTQGVELTFRYDPQRVSIRAEQFDILYDQKGFTIWLYDTQLLNKALHKKNTILHQV